MENAAYLFQTMIDGLVNFQQPQEQQYRHIIVLLTSVKQGSVKGLPPTIGECMQALKAKKYDKDNPHYTQAITGKYTIKYKAAMEMEVQALECVNKERCSERVHGPSTYLGLQIETIP